MALRCPECGRQQPAGIIAQPWRFRKSKHTLMAAVWLLLLALTFFGITGTLGGIAQSTDYAALKPFGATISQYFVEADRKYHVDMLGRAFNPEKEISLEWWDDEGKAIMPALFKPKEHIDWIVLTDWLWYLLIAPAGALFSRVLLYRSHWIIQGLFLIGDISLSVLAIWIYLNSDFVRMYYFQTATPIECVRDAVGGVIAWPTIMIGSAAYLLSYWLIVPAMNRLQPLIPRMPRLFAQIQAQSQKDQI